MPLTLHLLAATIVLFSWFGLVVALVRTAPVAHQTRAGFHAGEGLDED